jgi:hypothetical protein
MSASVAWPLERQFACSVVAEESGAPQGLLPLLVGHTQAFVPPQAVDPLVVDPPTGIPGRIGPSAPSPPMTLHGEAPQERTVVLFVLARHRGLEPLGGPWLPDNSAGLALTNGLHVEVGAESIDDNHNQIHALAHRPAVNRRTLRCTAANVERPEGL